MLRSHFSLTDLRFLSIQRESPQYLLHSDHFVPPWRTPEGGVPCLSFYRWENDPPLRTGVLSRPQNLQLDYQLRQVMACLKPWEVRGRLYQSSERTQGLFCFWGPKRYANSPLPKPSSFVGHMIPVTATKSCPISTKSATGQLLTYRCPVKVYWLMR